MHPAMFAIKIKGVRPLAVAHGQGRMEFQPVFWVFQAGSQFAAEAITGGHEMLA